MEKINIISSVAYNIKDILIPEDKIEKLYVICKDIDNSVLYENICSNLLDEIYISISECVINEYHIKRSLNEILGENREERNKFFYENFSVKISFAEYILNKYELLKELLKAKLENLLRFYEEIIVNYRKDLLNINKLLNYDIGKIRNISIQAGDMHNGKTVSIIECESGKIVYKPRKIESDIFIEKLIKYISKYFNNKIDFFFPKYLYYENYTWQEFVKQKECYSLEEVHRYYYRSGIYLGIFYILSTVDIHYENMISHGEYPVFIDLETMVRAENSIETFNQSEKFDSKSVLISSLLPAISSGKIFDVNMSALFTGNQVSNKLFNTVIIPDSELDWVYSKRNVVINSTENKMLYNGKEVEPFLVEKDVINGFRDVLEIINSKKVEVLEFLTNINSNIKIRQVLRPTHIYWKFIDASHHPECLSSIKKYNSIFDILLSKFTFGKHGFLRVEKEVSDLKKGNIPLFYALLNEKHLYSDNEIICENYYFETPFDTIMNKIRNLDQEIINYQIRLIQISFLTLYGFDKTKQKIKNKNFELALNGEQKIFQENDIKVILNEYSNFLSKNIIPLGDEKFSMLAPYVNKDGFIIEGIQPGLYHTGGLIWYLAVYGYIYNADYVKYAKGMLKVLISQYSKEKLSNNKDFNFSVYCGNGGLLYITYNFYKLFKEKFYLDISLEIINDIINFYKNTNLKDEIDNDFYKGLPGVLYVLCEIYLDIKEDKKEVCRIEEIESLGNKFLEFIDKYQNNNYGLAHGISGIALTISILYKITSDSRYSDKLKNLLMDEIKLSEKNYNTYSWCNGKNGVVLARHLMMKLCNDDKNLIKMINETTPKLYEKNNNLIFDINEYGLCHGLYGNLEILKEVEDSRSKYIYNKYFNSLLDIKWFEHS